MVKAKASSKASKTTYECTACGYEAPQYIGRCPHCQAWNTFEASQKHAEPSVRQHYSGDVTPQLLKDISLNHHEGRYSSGLNEVDRVLGGGVVPGSYLLIGGDPGVGKSTLMLQWAQHVALQGRTVLIVAGEESPQQIKLRSQRMGLSGEQMLIFPETQLKRVVQEIQSSRPDFVVIDSIQSLYHPDLSGTPGSISQLKECASELMQVAKTLDVTIALIGHVTKDGVVAGPKLLEHMVDTVLYLEGEKFENLRLLRAVKNRFGNVNEIGVFDMQPQGLIQIDNPSALFLSERRLNHQIPGSVVMATIEGNRPILVEIQALVGVTTYPTPRRVANGIDINRLHQVIAVLERRLGVDLSRQDIYVNVVGGFRLQEPAGDLPVALALVSSLHDVPVKAGCVVAGEIGLTGEIRPIGQSELRAAEAKRLGFETIILPESAQQQDLNFIGVNSLMEAIPACLQPHPEAQVGSPLD